jgi:adenylate cyclase
MRKTQVREILFLVVFWVVSAAFIVTYEASARGFERTGAGVPYNFPEQLLIALLVTAVAGTAIACFEVLYLSRVLRRRPYGITLLTKTAFYLSCILIFTSTAALLIQSASLGRPIYDPAVTAAFVNYWASGHAILTVLYWGAAVLYGLFVLQVSEKFGQGVLIDFLLGRYHRPKEEQRIFMFMDLRSSTTYAEKLGHIRYSRLIQDCFYDLTDVVTRHHAVIYQYVGDEVVLTWDIEGGVTGGDCIRIFEAYDATLRDRASHYETAYGFVPEFKAGVNAGLVTVAEVGEIKKELAYHGDVLNTAARIQGKCNELGQRLLVSEELKELVAGVTEHAFNPMGEAQLKGKAQPVRIYGVEVRGA